MDPEVRAFLERMAGSIAREFASINQKFEAVDDRFEAINQKFSGIDQKFSGIDQKFVAIDQHFAGLRLELSELRQSMDERFDTLKLRMDQFEDRVHGDIAGLRHDVTLLSVRVEGVEQQVRSLTLRTGKVEDGLLALNGRIDNLAETTRQRFRAIN